MTSDELKAENDRQLRESIELMQKVVARGEKEVETSRVNLEIYRAVLSGLIELENKEWRK